MSDLTCDRRFRVNVQWPRIGPNLDAVEKLLRFDSSVCRNDGWAGQGQTADRLLIYVNTDLGAKDLLNSRMA